MNQKLFLVSKIVLQGIQREPQEMELQMKIHMNSKEFIGIQFIRDSIYYDSHCRFEKNTKDISSGVDII